MKMVRISSENGTTFSLKVECDGVVIPCTRVEFVADANTLSGLMLAKLTVPVSEIDLQDVPVQIRKAFGIEAA